MAFSVTIAVKSVPAATRREPFVMIQNEKLILHLLIELML